MKQSLTPPAAAADAKALAKGETTQGTKALEALRKLEKRLYGYLHPEFESGDGGLWISFDDIRDVYAELITARELVDSVDLRREHVDPSLSNPHTSTTPRK